MRAPAASLGVLLAGDARVDRDDSEAAVDEEAELVTAAPSRLRARVAREYAAPQQVAALARRRQRRQEPFLRGVNSSSSSKLAYRFTLAVKRSRSSFPGECVSQQSTQKYALLFFASSRRRVPARCRPRKTSPSRRTDAAARRASVSVHGISIEDFYVRCV